MGEMNTRLNEYRFTRGEKTALCAGPILGAAAGLVFSRYALMPKTYDNPLSEALAWGFAFVAGLPLELGGAAVGGAAGFVSAFSHRQSRLNPRKLEKMSESKGEKQ